MNKSKKDTRPSWDEYFISISEVVGARSTCDRGRTGCVITRDKNMLVTGYAGSPTGLSHCDEVGHEMHTVTNSDGKESRHCIRTSHAEQNALAQAGKRGINLDGGTLYCSMTPCYTCAKMLINAGIKRVVAKNDYHSSDRTKEIFKNAGVEFTTMSKDQESYEDQ